MCMCKLVRFEYTGTTASVRRSSGEHSSQSFDVQGVELGVVDAFHFAGRTSIVFRILRHFREVDNVSLPDDGDLRDWHLIHEGFFDILLDTWIESPPTLTTTAIQPEHRRYLVAGSSSQRIQVWFDVLVQLLLDIFVDWVTCGRSKRICHGHFEINGLRWFLEHSIIDWTPTDRAPSQMCHVNAFETQEAELVPAGRNSCRQNHFAMADRAISIYRSIYRRLSAGSHCIRVHVCR